MKYAPEDEVPSRITSAGRNCSSLAARREAKPLENVLLRGPVREVFHTLQGIWLKVDEAGENLRGLFVRPEPR